MKSHTANHRTVPRPGFEQEARITLERIAVGLRYLAYLIQTRPEGPAYWPIFERLERERSRSMDREVRLDEAIQRSVRSAEHRKVER